MPSLQQLEEFKSSFKNVGNEALILTNQQIPFENVQLPGNEPPAPFPEGLEAPEGIQSGEAGLDFDNLGFPDFGTDAGFPAMPAIPPDPASPEMDLGGDFGFGDLLGDPAALPDPLGAAMDLPEDLLSGFSEDLESSGLPEDSAPQDLPDSGLSGSGLPDSFPDFPAGEAVSEAAEPAIPSDLAGMEETENAPVFPDLDLTQALDMGGELLEPMGEAGPPAETGDVLSDEGGELPGVSGDFDLGDLGDFGIPEAGGGGNETPAEDETPAQAGDLGGDFGDLTGDFGDLGGEAAASETTAETASEAALDDFGAGGFDLGGDFETAGPADDDLPADVLPELNPDEAFPAGEAGAEGGSDSFDTFNLEGEEPDFSAPEEESAADVFGAENFSLDGFDDVLDGQAAPKAGVRSTAAASEVEEIQLSEDDYGKLQETLSSYPLNLRIACEELIAEQAVAPDLMSAMIKLLVRGAPARESASLAGKILGRSIAIPRGYAKQTGAELEEEQGSFGYIFVHTFLPVLRIVGAAALVLASVIYLSFRFIYTPLKAEGIYKEGYERLLAGEYVRANERFLTAFEKHRVKKWFYTYAEGFRDERQYIYAQQKYDELLRVYPRDKKGALDYASMETNYLRNYEKADRIIRTNILDWSLYDREGLIALAENNLAWGETDPPRYEEARAAYARLLERYGRQDPFLEGMLKYFIRTDKLEEVLPLQAYFMDDPKKRRISVPALAELGGYLLDKRFEDARRTSIETAVPDEYVDKIDGIRDVLLRAIREDGGYPESYYHLARYYNRYGSDREERLTLEKAVEVFAAAGEDNSRRAAYRADSHRLYGEVLIKAREFFPAEAELLRGRRIYEDARVRGVLKTRDELGRIYTDLGDIEFYIKDGNMETALSLYEEGERNGWAPPEVQYRMGAAHYQLGQWEEALQRFFAISGAMPNNKRLLYALGNVSYMRGNYFAAQAYYNRLMDLLDAERVSFTGIGPGSGPDEMDLAERIMVADNNLGVTLETLTRITGNTGYRSRALALFSESIRAWDALTRDPDSMSRMRPVGDLYGPGVNLAFINVQNGLKTRPGYEPQIFMRIDRDVMEPSEWEALVPRDYRLSGNPPVSE